MTLVVYHGQLREALTLTEHVAILRAGELQLETVPRDAVTPYTSLQSAAILRHALRLGYRMEPTLEGDELVERWYRPDGTLAVVARRPRLSS